MAQAMAAAAAHSMPPFPLPALPRIRPPPIPKGTPGPNTLPMPNEPRPNEKAVWADGKWVLPHYNGARHRQKIISRQLEKALRHEVRGMNIYAYKNKITQQVVYSLTKNMDNSKMMKQLIFHGKKTVPSSLRRDHWSPYFSVHFPKTPDGAAKGLEVFRHLRELSLRRQLDPPKYLKIIDEAALTKFKERAGHHLIRLLKRNRMGRGQHHKAVDIPIPGQRASQRELKNRLMFQKATSVADLAAVLTAIAPNGGGIRAQTEFEEKKTKIENQQDSIDTAVPEQLDVEESEREPLFTQELTGKSEQKEVALMSLSDRALKRIQAIKKQEEKIMVQINARKQYSQQEAGQVRLDRHTLARLSTEYEGSIGSPGLFPMTFGMIEAKNSAEKTRLALEKAIEDMTAEMNVKRQEIERVEAARIDQELAAKTAEERQQIERATQAEKQQIVNLIDTELTKTRDLLKQYRDQARVYRATLPGDQKMLVEDRLLVRETTQYLLQKKAYLMQRYATWCGPYTEITARVDEAMAAIEEAYQERMAELDEEIQTNLQDKLEKNAQGVLVRWANPNDGQYAESWPQSVLHGKLEDKAVVLEKTMVVRQHAHLDANEGLVDEQMTVADLPRSNTVHVFGAEDIDERYQGPDKLHKPMQESREKRVAEHLQTSKIQARDKLITLQILRDDLTQELDYVDPDLRKAIKAQVDEVVDEFENNLQEVINFKHSTEPEWIQWVEYMYEKGVADHEAGLIPSMQEKLSKITPDGKIVEEPSSVMDTTISTQAKELVIQLADVRAEIALLKFNQPHIAPEINEDVAAFEKFAALFRERTNLGQLYPAAEEWLAQEQSQEHSIFQQTDGVPEGQVDSTPSRQSNNPPEGVSQLRDFESQHDFIGGAMQRSRLNADSSVGGSPAERIATLNRKIMQFNKKLAKLVPASEFESETKVSKSNAGLAAIFRQEIKSLKEDRVKLIQASNPVFDKQAWKEYRQQEMGFVDRILEAENEEADRVRRDTAAVAPEPEKPASFMDRVKSIFSRR